MGTSCCRKKAGPRQKDVQQSLQRVCTVYVLYGALPWNTERSTARVLKYQMQVYTM